MVQDCTQNYVTQIKNNVRRTIFIYTWTMRPSFKKYFKEPFGSLLHYIMDEQWMNFIHHGACDDDSAHSNELS